MMGNRAGPLPAGSPGLARMAVAAGLCSAAFVVAVTLARIAWLVIDAARPCPACADADLPDLGGAVAVIGTVYGLLYALLASGTAWGLARLLGRPGRRLSAAASVLAASLALVLVHGLEGRVSAPFFLLNAASLLVVAVLAARGWRAEPSSCSAGGVTRR